MKMHLHYLLLEVSIAYFEAVKNIDPTGRNLSDKAFVFLINRHNKPSFVGLHKDDP